MKWLLALLIAGSAHAQTLSYLGQQIVPGSPIFRGLPVGGLSSIDFVAATGHYLAICDDRSDKGPARFYELALDLSAVQQVTLSDNLALGSFSLGSQASSLAAQLGDLTIEHNLALVGRPVVKWHLRQAAPRK